MSGYLRVLCTVFLLSVPFVNCLTNATSSTANVTATDSVQRPQQSSLDKYLRTQRSFVIVSSAETFNALQDSSEVQNVTSDNYPLPYPIKKVIMRLSVTNATGMNIIINDLEIDPSSDYIALIPINSNGTEGRSYLATGKLKQPLAIRVLGYTKANLVFESSTSPDHSYRGFSISYSPYGEAPLPSTQPPDVTLAYSQLQTISKLLVINKKNQTISTWNRVKQLFADSTNLYIPSTNLSLESAFPENVTLTRVAECFNNWPNSDDCVELEFAITLYNDTSKNPTDDPFLDDRTPREPAGLNDLQLEEMWVQFGKSIFEREGIIEYELPDTRTRILMWVGIAIGTCVLLFLIFVAVFRSPAFRDRWVEDDTVAIKNKDEDQKRTNDDITMYPSPDQIVPEMYPGSSNGQIPPNEFGMESRIRNFESSPFAAINEAYTEDEKPSTRMIGRHTEQSQADASV